MNKIILSLIVLFSFINLNAQCTLEKGNSDFPFTINGVTVTGSGTGGYTSYSSAWTSCGVSTKANSVWIGQSPSTYTNNFSAGVNDMIYNMTAADPGEVITITSNGGAVSITSLASTCTNAYTINGNQLSFVNVSNSGVKVKISTPNPFTTINFSHNGSSGGVLMTMCFDGVAAVLSNPQINNLSATNITSASATINANVAADGGSTITARGFYYGTTSNPTTNQTPLTGTLGSMSTSISGLTPGTLYYYRAYATNANGTTYAQDTFSTTVGNSPPTISTISNQNNCEGQAINIINFTVNDAETPSSLLTLTATSSNNSLIPNDSLVLGGTGNNRTLSYNPISGVYDSSTITITVNDTSGGSAVRTFKIYTNTAPNISLSNDSFLFQSGTAITPINVTNTGSSSSVSYSVSPTLPSGLTINSSNGSISGTPNVSSVKTVYTIIATNSKCNDTVKLSIQSNSIPSISAIPNQILCSGNTPSDINITIADAETSLSNLILTSSSSNTALVANDSISIIGTGAQRTIRFRLIPGVIDTSNITISINDADGGIFSRIFTVKLAADKIQLSQGTKVVNKGTASIIDSNIVINETDTIKSAIVIISNNFNSGDVLSFNGTLPSGINQNYNTSTGILTFTGNFTPTQLQNVFKNIRFNTTSNNTSNRTITFSLGNTLPFSDNSHYYEFVNNSGITWTAAKTAAEQRSLYGLQGYLATITSAAENQFVASKLQGQGWFGASDAAAENVWKWETGPEAGIQFWQGLSTGNAVGGLYNNWESGEPNNAGDEDYAHFLSSGKWNDYPNSVGMSIQGYVVEYGGLSTDPCVTLSAIKTISINVPPVINGPSNNSTSNTSISIYQGITQVHNYTSNKNVTWNIIGGFDSSKFTLSSNGTLVFKNAPNFQNPTDHDTNNSYIVTISATDSIGGVSSQTLTVNILCGGAIFGSGANSNGLGIDTNWKIVYLPQGHDVTSDVVPYDAKVINGNTLPGTFINRFGFTNAGNQYFWIGPKSDANSIRSGDYNWVIEQTFNVPVSGFYDFTFTGAGDNEISFYLNGNIDSTDKVKPIIVGGSQIGSNWNSFSATTTFTGTAFLPAGINRAYMLMRDFGGLTCALISGANFSCNNNYVNISPSISVIANQRLCDGETPSAIDVSITDPETPNSGLIISATSSNTALIPNDSISITGISSAKTLKYNILPGVYDSSNISILVDDGAGGTFTRTFTVFVNADKVKTSADSSSMITGGPFAIIDSAVIVNETNSITDAKVLISEGFVLGDQLDFQGILPSGVTKNYNAATGVLSLSGNISPSDLQSIFRNVQIKTTSTNAQNRKVTFMIGSAIPYGQNNHYYEFVTNQGISFNDAKTAAENLTFYGLKGYLATITSQAENQFVVSKLQGQGWFGASDAASEGVWKWVSGPEAGIQFWSGGSNGSPVSGRYHNWAPGEPNNCCGGENYIHFLTNGQWNDYPLTLSSIQGYVVEYGGIPGDGCVKLTADKMVKVTLNVAPTITSISNQEVCFNDTLNNVSFTINDLNDDVNTLNVSVASSNTNLIDASNISITRTNGALNLSLYSNTGSTGTSTITITVEDSYGASNSTSFDVTVQDIINPVAITKNITIELDSIGNASITPSMINDGSNDNCKLDSLSVSQIAFNCSHLGSNQVILTAYDLFGNTDTAFAIVTVVSNDIDTDNDGMKDNCDDDDDNDGLTDLQEIQIGTNPKNPDSDGDGVSDSKEVTDNTNPLSNCSFILASQNLTPNATWNNADCDNDGLTNAEEVNLNTDPLNPDSDGDGIKDGEEIKIGTDPLNPDSDGDGINDGEEVSKGWNPLVTDTDGDGLTDGEEVKLGTDPLKKDTDGDGVIDGQEVKDGTNPLDPCASNYNNKTEDYNDDFLNGDCDKDGISNGDEIGPNRNNPFDANNNGIPDYLEFNNFVAGTAADSLEIYNALSTNGDGLNDVLVIRNVNLYPDNNIVIYNKWGVVIYQASGYGQNNKFFRGKVNTKGKDEETVSTGTYYYVFKYKDKKDVEKTVVGYLYISN